MSSPDIQTLISRSCLINSDDGHTSLTINPDDLEHPTKLIKFLVGVRYQNEYFPLGGSWSESLDGANPDTDSQVLIRTAIRCVHAQTGIDLSKCINWYVTRCLPFEPSLHAVPLFLPSIPRNVHRDITYIRPSNIKAAVATLFLSRQRPDSLLHSAEQLCTSS